MHNLSKSFALAALIVTAATSQAFVMRFDGTGFGRNVSYVLDGHNRSAFMGQLRFTRMDNMEALITMCVDLDHTISGGQQYNVNRVNTLTLPDYAVAGSVYANSFTNVTNNDRGAALQLAVWASFYGLDLTTNTGGRFRLQNSWRTANPAIVSLAQTYVSAGIANPLDAYLYMPSPRGGGQAQITAVPEPASMLALGAGLAALAARRRRRK